jgi:hypothetical protein
MARYEIKLTPADQAFTCSLGGVTYKMQLRWNPALEGVWVLDIHDSNNVPIVDGLALTAGVNILGQYDYLYIGGTGGYLYCGTDGQWTVPPTQTNLGVVGHLIWEPYA